jgi:hypothetical protein
MLLTMLMLFLNFRLRRRTKLPRRRQKNLRRQQGASPQTANGGRRENGGSQLQGTDKYTYLIEFDMCQDSIGPKVFPHLEA